MALPLVRDVPGAPQPADLLEGLANEPWVTWLDTALPGEEWGRHSFLATDPFLVLRGRCGRAEWIGPRGVQRARNGPFVELAGALRRHRLTDRGDLPPFCGGAAGMFGYELAAHLERIPEAGIRDVPTPDLEIGLYDLVVGWDHLEERCWLASTGAPYAGDAAVRHAARRMRAALAWLDGGPPPAENRISRRGIGQDLSATSTPRTYPAPGAPGLRSTFSRQGYRAAVRRAIEYIRAGDVYQVNLSQRFEIASREEHTRLYRRLREASPAPFGVYFSASGYSVLSTSPERFLRATAGGSVQTRPIKGTRPRDEDPEEDRRLAESLQSSVKDRAENLMIVDLLRNDLSRVCSPDSVRALDLFRVESFETVHHLVSTIEGRLSEERTPVDLLMATFPSGSVTGVPKIRAMEIISELEPVARGPYCGALGYLGFAGDMDTSVSIRIAVADGERVTFHSGGAVVVDSDPAAEYEETLDKARALVSAIPGIRR